MISLQDPFLTCLGSHLNMDATMQIVGRELQEGYV